MSIFKTNKLIRNISGPDVVDPSSIERLIYNQFSGAQKNISMGHHLVPLNINATTFTTDATTARSVPTGSTLAIYNTAGVDHSVTLGDNAGMAALGLGTTDSNGNVGIACPSKAWTYISTFDRQFVRTNNAALLVYLVKDESLVSNQGR